MKEILFEMGLIILLLVGNGIFAMAEISIVSVRKGRLRLRAEAGDVNAKLALELAESPNRFLATVQIGITLVGIIAGAFGGATMAEKLAQLLREVSWLAPYAAPIAFTMVVALITYLSLIIGELLPKQLGLAHPESVARVMARPMQWLSRIASPAVTFLNVSSDLLLRLFGARKAKEAAVSEDDVKVLVREGLRAGVFKKAESEMVERVLALDKIQARDLMTPRAKIIWINVNESQEMIWHKVVVSGHTRFPVYEGTRDNVVGVISVKALYANLAAGVASRVKDVKTAPLIVPAMLTCTRLLETFKRTGRHLALVTDEFGGVTGLVTVHDVLEAIVGDFPSLEKRLQPTAKRRDDGSWLVDAAISADEFQSLVPEFRLDAPEHRDYETFGGFVLKHLGVIPQEGDAFEHSGYRVEVIDMDGNRIDKLALMPVSRVRTGGDQESATGA